MIINDVFDYKGKKAIYVCADDIKIPPKISKVVIENKLYDVIKHEITHSLVGLQAITILLNTTDELPVGNSIEIK
ncbi:MAG: hypothetical protein IKB02_06865 [Clostridia bacterium]|nr:hypothetical protein [Clostridia bacterium]